MGTTVRASGPLFDGRAEQIMVQARASGLARVSEKGSTLARAAFDAAIRVNSGKFVGSVRVVQHSATFSDRGYSMSVSVPQKTEIVTTSTASYGPWLEGVGSRNATTRFRGYHGFRQAAGQLNAVARTEAQTALRPFIARLNGA